MLASGLSVRGQQETETDDVDRVHALLEMEKQNNKLDSWNKIDKMMKVRKLNAYADRYGREHNLSIQEIKSLKAFFLTCLDTSRLQKSKDVVYDRDTQEIKEIPSLYLHPLQRNFTLRIIDNKRVSTLKALAPRRKKEAHVEEANSVAKAGVNSVAKAGANSVDKSGANSEAKAGFTTEDKSEEEDYEIEACI
jgi:hypothetical protein